MILVNNFIKKNGRFCNGIVEVLYWDMLIYCEVIIFRERNGLYIKIPQRVDKAGGKKINIIHWRSKEVSDEFQEEVKSQLAEKFPNALVIESLQKIKEKIKNCKRKPFKGYELPERKAQ